MISLTKAQIKKIALRLGFGSASYFTQFIRRETGKTPRAIRASGKWQKRRKRKKL
jgi:AraC-like DNA-binding protein